jgi:hypothetical protein
MEKLGQVLAIVGVAMFVAIGFGSAIYNNGCGPFEPVSIQIDGECRALYR